MGEIGGLWKVVAENALNGLLRTAGSLESTTGEAKRAMGLGGMLRRHFSFVKTEVFT